MAFFLKFTKGDPPGKKLPTPERSAEEIDDSRERYEQKRTRFSDTLHAKLYIRHIKRCLRKVAIAVCITLNDV
jgi:hypothetical protein